MVEEIGHLFASWADTERLAQLMNDELQVQQKQESAESAELTRELARVENETENLRNAVKAGLDDIDWASAELDYLKAERADLLARQEEAAPKPKVMRVDASLVERCREAFGEVFSTGTREEKRQWVSLFMKRIEVDPDAGDILMHLFDCPTMLAPMQTPASKETGVCIELVTGAGFEPATSWATGPERRELRLRLSRRHTLSPR